MHIVDSTLKDQTGHAFSFLKALLEHIDWKEECCIWADRKINVSFEPGIQVKAHFYRRIRRLQTLKLFFQWKKIKERVFIPSCTRTDLLLLDTLMSSMHLENWYLYFHWFNTSSKKEAFLKKFAAKHTEVRILTPTQSTYEIFLRAGFKHVHLVPYPIVTPVLEQKVLPFKHVLYAGAARVDKGFPHAVALARIIRDQNLDCPMKIQASAPHSGQQAQLIEMVEELKNMTVDHIHVIDETLDRDKYVELYQGAITLNLYNCSAFSDRVSGVALDSFLNGAPIISSKGTWIANQVKRFGAGIVVESLNPDEVYRAILNIREAYSAYQEKAFLAAETLSEEHNPKHTIRVIFNESKSISE